MGNIQRKGRVQLYCFVRWHTNDLIKWLQKFDDTYLTYLWITSWFYNDFSPFTQNIISKYNSYRLIFGSGIHEMWPGRGSFMSFQYKGRLTSLSF